MLCSHLSSHMECLGMVSSTYQWQSLVGMIFFSWHHMVFSTCVCLLGNPRGSGGGGSHAGRETPGLHAERGPGGTGTGLLHPTAHEVHRQTPG